MSSYNPLERKLASLLDRYPKLKNISKLVYQQGNYHLFGNRNFEYTTHPDAEIEPQVNHFGISSEDNVIFFGYFDINPWNREMTNAVFHRPNSSGVDIVRYNSGGKKVIANSEAWNYQQGARTQWHPQQKNQILFNDFATDSKSGKDTIYNSKVLTRTVDTSGQELETYPMPLQSANPTECEYVSLSYRRLDRNSPDYGYGADDGSPLLSADKDGLWSVEMNSKSCELLFTLSTLIDETPNSKQIDDEQHYLNHALYNPTGEKIVFVHRWKGENGKTSRLYVFDRQNNERRLLMDDRIVSHYCWIDTDHLLVWGRSQEYGFGYHIIDVRTGNFEFVNTLEGYGDGHPSVSPDRRWIVTDTYPDRARKRHLLLYNLNNDKIIEVGKFHSPLSHRKGNRCDLHPRFSPCGTIITIDSTHEGYRHSYNIDVSALVGKSN